MEHKAWQVQRGQVHLLYLPGQGHVLALLQAADDRHKLGRENGTIRTETKKVFYMNQVFFISDTHFGHRNICKYRPEFQTPEEHDEYIIERWNSVLTKAKQQVWCLGDMCIKNKYYDFHKLMDRLNGTIHVITGNHCHLPAYGHPKIHVEGGLTKRYGFWISHAPIHPDELRGRRNIHGHVHYKSVADDRYINVCCENINYTPIDIDELRRHE